MGTGIERMQVVLVNLISPRLNYDQHALASQTLARYLHTRVPDVPVQIVDMQAIYNEQTKISSDGEAFASTKRCVVDTIHDACTAGPSIVGLSIKWQTRRVATEILTSIQRSLTDKAPLFLLGNVGTTLNYHELLSSHPFTNALAVIGEGEDALVNIVDRAISNITDYKNKQQYVEIPNVVVNVDGKIVESEQKVVDLAEYPKFDPEYDLYLRDGKITPSSVYDIETSRGCPWGKCTFCSVEALCMIGKPPARMRQSGWRPFPTDIVLDHIYSVAKVYGVRKFDIKDSEFMGYIGVGGKKSPELFEDSMMRVEQFATGLIEINEKLGLKGQERLEVEHISVRADAIYREGEPDRNLRRKYLLGLLKQAGVKGIFLGIESGSPGQLRRYNKGVTVQENKQALEILREVGFGIEPGFIFFDHNATLQDLSENLMFIRETRLDEVDSRVLTSLRILEGSALAHKYSKSYARDSDSLVYTAPFKDSAVSEIERLFQVWEEPIRELMNTLPIAERLQIRHLDLDFVEDLVKAYMQGVSAMPVLHKHVQTRSRHLSRLKSAGILGDKGNEAMLRNAQVLSIIE